MGSFLEIFDISLLEAVGLNLIFGVIDVTWICYAELVMIGMYGMYFMVQSFGFSYWLAAPIAILLVAGLGGRGAFWANQEALQCGTGDRGPTQAS